MMPQFNTQPKHRPVYLNTLCATNSTAIVNVYCLKNLNFVKMAGLYFMSAMFQLNAMLVSNYRKKMSSWIQCLMIQ